MPSRGTITALAAYGAWGLSPLFWRLLGPVPVAEQFAHRVLWSLPLVLLVAWAGRTVGDLRGLPARRRLSMVVGGALLLVNWGVYLWAVTADRVVEASLGYYMNPLVSVVLGVAVLGERLRRVQWVSVGLAAAGVLYLSVRLGTVPWVALTLAVSFGLYGLMQKGHHGVGPWASMGGEIAWMWPVALAAVVVWGSTGDGALGAEPLTTTLLVLTGPVTVLPLLWFGVAARALPLTALGILQYLAPTLQLAIGVWLFGEPMPVDRLVGFAFVWVAVAVYVADLVWAGRTVAGAAPRS